MPARHSVNTLFISFLALAGFFFTSAQALSQSYCSNQNTGSSYAAVGSIYNSFLACQATCNGGNYAFAVLQGEDCWCSNYVPAGQTALSSCSDACPGYPPDVCGNLANNLYSYVALGPDPLSSASATPVAQTNPSVIVAPVSTVFFTSVNTVVSFSTIVQQNTIQNTITNNVQNTITNNVQNTVTNNLVSILTLRQTVTAESVITAAVTVAQSPAGTASASGGAASSVTLVPSVSIKTVSGAIIYVTTTPTTNPLASQPQVVANRRSGISGGAIAGIVVGAIIGAALLGFLLFFCCRGRRGEDEAGEKSLDRNESGPGRAGLLGVFLRTPASTPQDTPKIGGVPKERPMSGVASSHMSDATHGSRPIYLDSRLNPAAIIPYGNASQTSLATLQDDRDYSRPLEVRNPS